MSKRAFFCVVAMIAGFQNERAYAWFQSKPLATISDRIWASSSRLPAPHSCVNRYDEIGGDCLTSTCDTACIEGRGSTEGSGSTPTPTPTPSPTQTPTPTPSPRSTPSPVPTATPSPTPSPTPTLHSSHVNYSKAVDMNHIFELVRLTRVTSEKSSDNLRSLSRELFTLAFHMPIGWDRVAEEKNALVPLSTIDPQLAMRNFRRVENPQPNPVTLDFPEDVRADAANYIFPNYLRFTGPRGIKQIRDLARHIGDTGEYPYRAIGNILEELSNKYNVTTQVTDELFEDAVTYFQRQRSKFLNRNEEFLEFLEKTRFLVLRSQYKFALRILISRLRTQEFKSKHYYIAEVLTSTATLRFYDQNQSLLFRALPLVFITDRALADELISERTYLRYATGEIIYQVAGVIRGAPSESQLSQLQNNVLQLAVLHASEKMRETNPLLASQLTKRLSHRPMLLISHVTGAAQKED